MKIDVRKLSHAEMSDLKSRLIKAMPIAKAKEAKAAKSAKAKAVKIAKTSKAKPAVTKRKVVKMLDAKSGAVYSGRGRKPNGYDDSRAKPAA